MNTNLSRHLTGLAMLILCTVPASCTNETAPAAAALPQHLVKAKQNGQHSRVRAADDFNRLYANSRFAAWQVHAVAAGRLCNVLLVRTPAVMDGSMVDAMHYGAGEYAVDGGGVQSFYLQQTFRGVAYRDGSGRIWTYGAVKKSEIDELTPCH